MNALSLTKISRHDSSSLLLERRCYASINVVVCSDFIIFVYRGTHGDAAGRGRQHGGSHGRPYTLSNNCRSAEVTAGNYGLAVMKHSFCDMWMYCGTI